MRIVDRIVDQEERVRERAHQIWEEEGCPEGRDKEHWSRACRELGVSEKNDGVSVVAGEGDAGPNLGPSPVTVIAGKDAQQESPYASVDPNTEKGG